MPFYRSALKLYFSFVYITHRDREISYCNFNFTAIDQVGINFQLFHHVLDRGNRARAPEAQAAEKSIHRRNLQDQQQRQYLHSRVDWKLRKRRRYAQLEKPRARVSSIYIYIRLVLRKFHIAAIK